MQLDIANLMRDFLNTCVGSTKLKKTDDDDSLELIINSIQYTSTFFNMEF